jgi:hypothetical protein
MMEYLQIKFINTCSNAVKNIRLTDLLEITYLSFSISIKIRHFMISLRILVASFAFIKLKPLMRASAIVTAFFLSIVLNAQISYDQYFIDKTLRFDFMLAGNNIETIVYPVRLKQEPTWAGSLTNLTDQFNYGNLRYEIYDSLANTLIYSRGFCTLYQEWQTTNEAKNIKRSFYEVATFPFPKNKVFLKLLQRNPDGHFTTLYETCIDPSDYYILKEKPVNTTASKIIDSGDPHICVDIAFIAEGYTSEEMGKFRSDVARLARVLLTEPPFRDFKNKINVWAVEAVSEESGTDVPGEEIYVNTAVNSSFYTFGLDRYLTSLDLESINDFAAIIPHDNIVVLINSKRYGGGGVYNYYTGTTSDNVLSAQVFIHEFGHGFAGLADEYYTSEVTYEDFYPLNVEPWEPNITTMVNFDVKWKNLVDKNTPVPTPDDEKYKNKVGVFEGGGYSAKGIYRPQFDCTMKSNGAKGFCTVCRDAVEKMIEFYTR